MPGRVSSRHLDDFTLLRYVALDLDENERGATAAHLGACSRCSEVLGSVERLDEEMKELVGKVERPQGLPLGDPFESRPEAPPRARGAVSTGSENLAMIALEASERAGGQTGRIHDAARRPEELPEFLSGLRLSEATVRFALLYALQETGSKIAESPVGALNLALSVVKRLEEEREEPAAAAARILPLGALAAQANLLAGQARTWTGELERARGHFEAAYRLFGASTGDDFSLAIVELGESQRRAFEGDPAAALVLATRARGTFEEMGQEDYAARGRVAEGICLSKLGRESEALECYRQAVPVFQDRGLWSNYVGAINSLGACLAAVGRLDEARREYARALRALSRENHPAWVGYVRYGLAHVLFRAGNSRAAARAFLQAAGLFRDVGNIANALTASLYEIECRMRCGEMARAVHRFEIFRTEVGRHDALDPVILRQLEELLSGEDPSLEEVSRLRESASRMMRDRLERNIS